MLGALLACIANSDHRPGAVGQFGNVERTHGDGKKDNLLSDLTCRRRPPMPLAMNRDFGTSALRGAFPRWPDQTISDCLASQRVSKRATVQFCRRGRSSRSSPIKNGQRATMQTPQGLDVQHGGELFSVEE